RRLRRSVAWVQEKLQRSFFSLICRLVPNPIFRRLIGIIRVDRERLGKVMFGHVPIDEQDGRNEILAGELWIGNIRWSPQIMPLVPDGGATPINPRRWFVREN